MDDSSDSDDMGDWMEDVYDPDDTGEEPSTQTSKTDHAGGGGDSSQSQGKKFKCELCDRHFAWPYQLQNHIEKGHPGVPNHCELCGKKFGWSNQLPSHVCIPPPAEARTLSYSCSVCGQSFKRAGILRRHMYKHPDSLKFHCDVCGRAFSAKSFLETHKKSHSPERYKGKKLGAKNRNTPAKPNTKPVYRCTECECFFRYPKGLEDHMNVHTGNKPHKCWQCGAVFAVVQSLMSHVTTVHSDAKPYKCEFCSAAFKRSGTLKQHRRIHTGETPYSCEECGRSFKQNSGLLRHRISHNRAHSNPCDVCGESFRYQKSLLAHKQRSHPEQTVSKPEDGEEPSLLGYGNELSLEVADSTMAVPPLDDLNQVSPLPLYIHSGPVFPTFEQTQRK